MREEYFNFWSNELGRQVEVKVYGFYGKPVLLFPCQGGRFFEAEDFGLINAISDFIDAGKIKVFTVDSVDNEAWACTDPRVPLLQRAEMADRYDSYITNEVAPFIRAQCGGTDQKFATCGCSFGAFHSVNVMMRHPEIFDTCISLSGVLQLSDFVGDNFDDPTVAQKVRSHSPLLYIRDVASSDPMRTNLLRQCHIVICSGQGAWEHMMLRDMAKMEPLLHEIGIPAWFDRWGIDVNHDWPWWKKQLPYFLGILCNTW